MRCVRFPGIAHSTQHHALTLLLATMAAGFACQWLAHNPAKPEFQITRVWWNTDRPIHAMIFLMAAISNYVGSVHTAGALVIADAMFSAVNRLL